MKNFSMIACATNKNNGIGINGKLPWSKEIPQEYQYFIKTVTKEYTKKKNVIITGRKSFLDSELPFKNTRVIVLTSEKNKVSDNEDVIYVNDLFSSFENIEKDEKVFICGGENVFFF
jgi:dihydrofolate reductase